LAEKIISQITFEMGQIDHMFETYAELIEQAGHRELNLVETTAMASVLHSFYNGLENLFLSIAKKIDTDVPASARWHRELLMKMTETTSNRPSVITMDSSNRLSEYLSFRHFYRHSYSFFLEWDELEKLVIPLPTLWKQIKDELQIATTRLMRRYWFPRRRVGTRKRGKTTCGVFVSPQV
jgi:hypothetical protein